MEKEIRRAPRVAVCRACGGTGLLHIEGEDTQKICPQCEGSGRVTVSSVTVLDIRPYRQRQIKTM